MRPHPWPMQTQPRQKCLDGDRTEARCGGRGLHCVQHDWVRVLFRLHHDDGCDKRYGAAVRPAAGQAACFGNHVPWSLDTGKQPFSESECSSSPKQFFWGNSLVADLAKIHTRYCKAFSWWLASTLWYFFGLTQFLFTVEWTYATVVSVDVSFVVRISEDACPSVLMI